MGREYYFENVGNNQQPEYELITAQIVVPTFYMIYQSPVFCDIDNDQDLDLFVSSYLGQIAFFENVGNPETYIFELIDSTFADIDIHEGPVPEFVDIDADGDFDLFIGIGETIWCGKMYYYRNDGSPDVPNMVFVSDYFNSIAVGGDSSPEFCDIDSDGDYDLFIGCDDGSIWCYENIGDSVNYDFEYVTNNYFNIDVGNMSVPRFCDIDADGDFDLFVANESSGFGNSIEGDMTFYENIGTPSNPQFSFITSQYLFMDMSSLASPAAVDIDDDGLIELLVGINPGKVVLLENNGTQTEPSFYFADSTFCNLNIPSQPKFSFGDLDADGDYDLVTSQAGTFNYIYLYENIGTASNPEYSYLQTITASFVVPCYYGVDLCDIDADGDLDLFFGSGSTEGFIEYWENIGAYNRPVLVFRTSNYLNQISTGYYFPRFADMDHDGDFDLIMGQNDVDTFIAYWRNEGTPQLASFNLIDTIAYFNYPEVLSLRPSLSDIDNDGDFDMFVGESGGAMLFYRNLENPYQAQLTISLSGSDVILTWGNIANAVEYRIFYQNIPYFTPSGTPQVTLFPPDTSWIDYGAVNEGGRWYRVVTE